MNIHNAPSFSHTHTSTMKTYVENVPSKKSLKLTTVVVLEEKKHMWNKKRWKKLCFEHHSMQCVHMCIA